MEQTQKRFQLYISDDKLEKLRQEAKKKDISINAFVKELIFRSLKNEN